MFTIKNLCHIPYYTGNADKKTEQDFINKGEVYVLKGA